MFTRNESLKQYMRFYPITSVLIVLNVMMFSYTMLTGGISTQHLYQLGGMVTTPPEAGAEVWRWFTSMFLHGSFIHLLMNMFSLYVFAPALERMLGRIRYLLFYVVCGFVASAGSAFFASEVAVSIGASGAIYGVFGGLLAISLRYKWRIAKGDRQIIYMILAINFVSGFFMTNVNILGHFGGLLAGFILMQFGRLKFVR